MKLNKSTILTIAGCVGVVVTTIAAWKQGPKIEKIFQDEELEGKVKAMKLVKEAAPLAISEIATLGCIIFSHRISVKEIAALGAALSYVTANRDIWIKKIKEKLPKEEFEKMNSEVVAEVDNKLHYDGGPSIEDTGYGQVLCLEGYSGRLFWSSYTAVENAIRDFNKKFIRDRNVSLNDFYELLGIEKTHLGYQMGWVHDPDWYDDEIDIQAEIMNLPRYGETVVIDIYTYPTECWQEI